MKKFVCGAVVLCAVGLRADIDIKIVPSQAPNDAGSPNWNSYAANAINGLINNTGNTGTPATPAAYTVLDQVVDAVNFITTTFPSWMGDASVGSTSTMFNHEYGNKLRLGASIIAENRSETFSLADVRIGLSVDNPVLNDYLSINSGFLYADLGYSPFRVGLVYGSNGRGSADDRWITSGSASQKVNALFMVGPWTAMYAEDDGSGKPYQQQVQEQAINILAENRDSTMTTIWEVFNTNHTGLLASAANQMTVVPEPSTLVLLVGGFGACFVGWRRQRRA